MSVYSKQTAISGKWAKASELGNIKRAKIVSETTPQKSQFLDKDNVPKTQDVCSVRFEGLDDSLNVSLNRATINGLVDAFGEDSKSWQGHYLSVETEKIRIAGKSVTALYLIPEGFERIDDANGYAVIQKVGEQNEDVKDVKVEDIPF